jgi:hypothetical protein
MMTADTMRTLLVVFLVALYVLSMFCLRRRPLTLDQYLWWGTFALLVPALGPFLVILSRPGVPPRRRARRTPRR